MKVFLGNNNVANILTGYFIGLEKNKIKVVSLEKEKSKFYDSHRFKKIYRFWNDVTFKSDFLNKAKEKIDFTIQNYRCKKYLKEHIEDTDVIILVWHSILSDFSDYEFIKKYNKKIITVFVGSDVRFSKAFAEQYNINIDKWEEGLKNDDINEKLNFIRHAELYSDLILSVPDQSGLLIRNYDHFFLPLDLSLYPFSSNQQDIPAILHAPTRSGAKGTEFFLQVIDQLEKEGLKFNFKLIQNLKHVELIELLKQSDILLDELYFHGPGMMGTEAMAVGCVVVTKKDNTATNVFDAPVCDVVFETLYDKLKELILDKNKRIELAAKAREFVEKNNDCKIVAKKIIEKLNESNRDYSPNYLESSDILSKESISQENIELTKQVKNIYQNSTEKINTLLP